MFLGYFLKYRNMERKSNREREKRKRRNTTNMCRTASRVAPRRVATTSPSLTFSSFSAQLSSPRFVFQRWKSSSDLPVRHIWAGVRFPPRRRLAIKSCTPGVSYNSVRLAAPPGIWQVSAALCRCNFTMKSRWWHLSSRRPLLSS